MKKFKALLVVACALLPIAASVFGTMAYLTSTDTVTNTFTVGKVKITLDEAQVNADGSPIKADGTVVTNVAEAERVKENSYKLLPGHTYTKDPTVTVEAGSEASYVRQMVTVTFDKVLTDAQLATQLDGIFTGHDAKWVRNDKKVETKTKDGAEYTVITYEYRYKDKVPATTTNTKLPALFTGIKVPETWTNETLAAFGNIEINIVAHAIQADGFDNADDAWAAFK